MIPATRMAGGLHEQGADVYARCLRGRRVAVVGPARTLLAGGLGPRIDAHDLVVRFNDTFDLFPIPPKLAADIGTRTDILYCNQVVIRDRLLCGEPADRARLLARFRSAGVRWIACTNNSLAFTASGEPADAANQRDARIISGLRSWLETGGAGIDVRVVCTASAILSRWLNGNWARTGLVGVFDLLTFDVAGVLLAGMTFYHGGGHLLATPAADLHPLKNRDGTWARSPEGPGHDSYRELAIMRVLARCFAKTISFDSSLRGLLDQRPSTT